MVIITTNSLSGKKRFFASLFLRRVFFCGLGLLVSAPVLAGQYGLVKGAGVEVCEAYRRNFEPRHDAEPMACERHYDPAIKGFASPEWQKLDVMKYIGLYKKAAIYINEYEVLKPLSKEDLEWSLQGTEARVKDPRNSTEFYLTRLDLNGDGKLANVLAIRENACGPEPTGKVPRTRLYVLNETLTDIDYPHQDSWGGWDINATIELYQGKPYIEAYQPDDNWGHLLTGSGKLRVFRELSPQDLAHNIKPDYGNGVNGAPYRLKTVCEIHYTPSPNITK